MGYYLGVDVGSVSTKLALLAEGGEVVYTYYARTEGKPIKKVQECLEKLAERFSPEDILGVATTGSGRSLAGVIVNADLVKNEITCQAVGAMHFVPDVQTVIEIGGQDSKIILIRNGVVVDFAMNTVCAAGTGSFLDHQALRLNIKIEGLGELALKSTSPTRIAGRCTVFAESDMIHKQQVGHRLEDILYGLCQALVRNYLNNVALGKEILPPVVFQGGVAFNPAIVKAFEEALGYQVIVPPYHQVSGAIGAALLVKEQMISSGGKSQFRGFKAADLEFVTSSFECKRCPNLCEIVRISQDGKTLACWGGRCDLWESVEAK